MVITDLTVTVPSLSVPGPLSNEMYPNSSLSEIFFASGAGGGIGADDSGVVGVGVVGAPPCGGGSQEQQTLPVLVKG
jgi:PPE-repeat protein